MTDFTESNISFWRAHDALRPFVERGMLDFALFDAERDADLQLEHAGTTLVKGSLGAAMVIANYVFDGISQDAFSFAEGELRECLVSLTSEEPVDDVAAPGLVGRLAASYEHRPASFDYYEEPAFNDILRSYGSHADGATILFPSAALRCLLRLSDLAGGRLLLLSGDRGEIHADALGEPECLGMAIHGGGFSVPVNYHAIAEYVLAAGGHVMKAPHRHTHLNVSAFVLGEHPFAWAETRLAYRGAFERGGPDDFFSLRRGILDHSDPLELHQTLSLVRSSRWDPRVLVDVLPSLWQQLGDATEPARRELRRTVERVWASYYHIGEDLDLAFELGLFLYALGAPAEAMAMFAESARLYGEDARARWNVGLCHYALGCVDEAARCFVEAARLDPGFKPQGALQVKTAL
jgi:tetratricopeptide (TPR) repeat protein